MDILFNYINTHPEYNMTIIYSTPEDYIEALYKEGVTYPTKTDDFFPYADRPNAYWTGYFTSRPELKLLVKYAGRVLNSYRKFIG